MWRLSETVSMSADKTDIGRCRNSQKLTVIERDEPLGCMPPALRRLKPLEPGSKQPLSHGRGAQWASAPGSAAGATAGPCATAPWAQHSSLAA